MFWPRKTSAPYLALAGNESDCSRENVEFLSDEQDSMNDVNPPEEKKCKISVALIACTIVLSIANIWFFIDQIGVRVFLKSAALSHLDLDLELASAYIGFDKLYSNDSYSTSYNYSVELEVGSVDRAHPDAVRPDETPHWWTFRGTVVPDRRHIFINKTISTIVQFRARDYGLEICQPTIILPSYASLVNKTVKSDHNKPRTFILSAPSGSIHVWALHSTTSGCRELEIDFAKLTFKHMPQRKTYLGVIEAEEGVSQCGRVSLSKRVAAYA